MVWCCTGRPKVPKPLASVPKKSVVKLKRDTANKASSSKKQVVCVLPQCLESSAPFLHAIRCCAGYDAASLCNLCLVRFEDI